MAGCAEDTVREISEYTIHTQRLHLSYLIQVVDRVDIDLEVIVVGFVDELLCY